MSEDEATKKLENSPLKKFQESLETKVVEDSSCCHFDSQIEKSEDSDSHISAEEA